jgi:hypothetical protein
MLRAEALTGVGSHRVGNRRAGPRARVGEQEIETNETRAGTGARSTVAVWVRAFCPGAVHSN